MEGAPDNLHETLSRAPDARWIAYEAASAIALASIETGERRELAQVNPALAGSRNPAVSPDGRRLAYVTANVAS